MPDRKALLQEVSEWNAEVIAVGRRVAAARAKARDAEQVWRLSQKEVDDAADVLIGAVHMLQAAERAVLDD